MNQLPPAAATRRRTRHIGSGHSDCRRGDHRLRHGWRHPGGLKDTGLNVLIVERGQFLPESRRTASPTTCSSRSAMSPPSPGTTPRLGSRSSQASTTGLAGTPRCTAPVCHDSAAVTSSRWSTMMASPPRGRSVTTTSSRSIAKPNSSSRSTVPSMRTRRSHHIPRTTHIHRSPTNRQSSVSPTCCTCKVCTLSHGVRYAPTVDCRADRRHDGRRLALVDRQ